MPIAEFTVEINAKNPHKEGTQIWKAGLIVTGMEGCHISEIINALTAFERVRAVGVQNPARWISHFAGLESPESGKSLKAWLTITLNGSKVTSRGQFREALATYARSDA
jgi:hypothetical protein